jgi:hypothetical protein
MATYKEIQEYIKQQYGYTPKTCWIADMKEKCGLKPNVANNRQSVKTRLHPCPTEKEQDLRDTFSHFNMI